MSRQREAARILEPLYRRHPDHPGLAHYLIHAYDSPALARDGMAAADRYASIAPSVPHAEHMPSHIYTRIGAWDKSIAANLKAAEAAKRFEAAKHAGAMWDQHAHALDYLAYAYLQLGRVADARAVAQQVAGVTETFPPGSLTVDYALAAIPARLALERDDWQAAETLPVRPAPAWRGAEGITRFARALGAARGGHAAACARRDRLAGGAGADARRGGWSPGLLVDPGAHPATGRVGAGWRWRRATRRTRSGRGGPPPTWTTRSRSIPSPRGRCCRRASCMATCWPRPAARPRRGRPTSWRWHGNRGGPGVSRRWGGWARRWVSGSRHAG